MPAPRTADTLQSIQAELLDIFGDMHRHAVDHKDKASSQRKLAARRAIEQHFEKRELERQINDCWAEES